MKAIYYIAELAVIFIVEVCITAPIILSLRFINYLIYKQNQK